MEGVIHSTLHWYVDRESVDVSTDSRAIFSHRQSTDGRPTVGAETTVDRQSLNCRPIGRSTYRPTVYRQGAKVHMSHRAWHPRLPVDACLGIDPDNQSATSYSNYVANLRTRLQFSSPQFTVAIQRQPGHRLGATTQETSTHTKEANSNQTTSTTTCRQGRPPHNMQRWYRFRPRERCGRDCSNSDLC